MSDPKWWSEVSITHVKGSGPGGQHRNKRMTGIRMIHLPTGITVLCTERRSQEQNLGAAYERMGERLRQHYYVAPTRHDTKPTYSSKKKRVEKKVRRGSIKNMRKKPRLSDTD